MILTHLERILDPESLKTTNLDDYNYKAYHEISASNVYYEIGVNEEYHENGFNKVYYENDGWNLSVARGIFANIKLFNDPTYTHTQRPDALYLLLYTEKCE